ncbi:MAG: hypothetical protein CMM56_06385 [Rhodospirillaceae bacterium]|nr:hypothetical protein [Rhodospirillaceae bacterium]
MGPHRNQREVENRLRDATRYDRARIQIGRISRFGLLEMSRQRIRPSLGESTQSVCGRCNGIGHVRGVESLALAILRLVGEEARKEKTAKVIAQLPLDVTNYVLNEKREWVQAIQDNNNVDVTLIANPGLDTPNYSIKRVREDESELPENTELSYKLAETQQDLSHEFNGTRKSEKPEVAAVSDVLPKTPAPKPIEKKARTKRNKNTTPWWKKIFGWLLPKTKDNPPPRKRSRRHNARGRNSQDRRRKNNNRSRDRNQRHGKQNRSQDSNNNNEQKVNKQQREHHQPSEKADGVTSRGRNPRRRRRSNSNQQFDQKNTKTKDINEKKKTHIPNKKEEKTKNSEKIKDTKISTKEPTVTDNSDNQQVKKDTILENKAPKTIEPLNKGMWSSSAKTQDDKEK